MAEVHGAYLSTPPSLSNNDFTTVPLAQDASLTVHVTNFPTGSGDASSANQTTGNASLSSIDTKTPSLVSGRQPVDGSGVTQPISASSLPLPSGASTSALQTTGNTSLGDITASLSNLDTKSPTLISGRLPVDGSAVTQPISGTVTVNIGTSGSLALDTSVAAISAKLGSLGQKTSANSAPIVIASDQSTLTTKINTSATATSSNVSASASVVTLLSSNTNRLGATFQNDSTDILLLKLGSTASSTSYTVRMISNSYYEVPFSYTGIITGIWLGTNGAVRTMELT